MYAWCNKTPGHLGQLKILNANGQPSSNNYTRVHACMHGVHLIVRFPCRMPVCHHAACIVVTYKWTTCSLAPTNRRAPWKVWLRETTYRDSTLADEASHTLNFRCWNRTTVVKKWTTWLHAGPIARMHAQYTRMNSSSMQRKFSDCFCVYYVLQFLFCNGL